MKDLGNEKNGITERTDMTLAGLMDYVVGMDNYILVRKYLTKKKVVLDLGCGLGYGTNYLAKYSKSCTGLDYSEDAIAYARETYKTDNIKFVHGDAADTKLKSNSFDVITSFEAIEHLKSPARFLKECNRLLKKNGVLVLSTPNKHLSSGVNPFHISELYPEELARMLKQQKFKIISIYAPKGNTVVHKEYNNPGVKGAVLRKVLPFIPKSVKNVINDFYIAPKELNNYNVNIVLDFYKDRHNWIFKYDTSAHGPILVKNIKDFKKKHLHMIFESKKQ